MLKKFIHRYERQLTIHTKDWRTTLFRMEWSWHGFKDFDLGMELAVKPHDEHGTFQFRIGMFFLVLYLGFFVPRWMNKTIDKRVMKGSYEGRETGFHLYNYTEGQGGWFNPVLTWDLWHTEHSWESKTPKWRHFYSDIKDDLFGYWIGEPAVLAEEMRQWTDTGIPNGGTYLVRLRVIKHEQKRKKWGMFRRFFHRLEIDTDPDELGLSGPAVPGKGENSWDCDDSSIDSSSIGWGSDPLPDDWQATIIRRFEKTLRDTRQKYGGKGWAPAAKIAV